MRRALYTWLLVAAACRETPDDPLARERRGPLVVADQPPLREDPVAGKRSSEQWDKHLQTEELERQFLFDKNRLPEHRVLMARIAEARAHWDNAESPTEFERARNALQPKLHTLRSNLDALDRWKNSSLILPDYEALLSALSDSYPAAKLAAIGGNDAPLRQAKLSFDAHQRTMREWLERVSGDFDEAVEEGGG
jgi:hypothetical protein